jgi:hypothetical protein
MSVKEIEIAVEVRRVTEKAMLVFDGKTEVWIPKSMITDQCETAGVIESVFLPEWFAIEKGLL